MEYRVEQIGGIRCRIWMHGQGGPVIYWGVSPDGEQQEQRVAALMDASLGKTPWALAAYEAENWNRDYSLWALPSIAEENEFAGGARETLDWLINVCIPHLESNVLSSTSCRMIGGYSLAGLFSLFAFYESQSFDGAASCSGSLWYPGWQEYAARQQCPKNSMIYLSLGRKEEKTRSRKMAAVGEMTRWQYEQVKQDANVRAAELIWHNGGHFSDVEQRIAQGFSWLIMHAKK